MTPLDVRIVRPHKDAAAAAGSFLGTIGELFLSGYVVMLGLASLPVPHQWHLGYWDAVLLVIVARFLQRSPVPLGDWSVAGKKPVKSRRVTIDESTLRDALRKAAS